MAGNKINTPQIVSKDTLDQLYHASEFFTTDTDNIELDNLLRSANKELTMPLRMAASSTPDLVLNVGAISLQNPETDRRKTIPPINNLLPAFTSGTVTFPASSGGTITVSPGTNATLTVSSGNYIKVGLNLTGTGNIVLTQGIEGASEAAATAPAALSGHFAIGYVVIHNTAGTIDNITDAMIVQYAGGGGGSGAGGTPLIQAYDFAEATLPTGTSFTVDGYTVVNDDLVFFDGLSSGGNKVYKVGGVGSSLTWTVQSPFANNSETPSNGESVRVQNGDVFGAQLGVFETSLGAMSFNHKIRSVRYASDEFYDQSSLSSLPLTDATSTMFLTRTAVGNENLIISYSIKRGSIKETGHIFVASDASSNVDLSTAFAATSPSGVTFSGVISSSNIVLSATLTSTGTGATMKYFVQSWAD